MNYTNKIIGNILGTKPKADRKSKNKRNLQQWIKDNREAIDEATQSPYKNDEERRLWVLNDEGLYNAYKSDYDL